MQHKIMIVDDAAFMRMMINDTLTKNGYTNIIEASDGQIAYELYQTERPDLVIMDITMPNMDGIRSLQAINKAPRCNSSLGQESMVVDAIRYGALDFIVKPFKPDRILQTVKKILG